MNTIQRFAKQRPFLTAVLFYILMNLIAGYSITLFVDIKAVYAALNTPAWAPATWVFGAAWTVNNILVLIGNVWTLKLPPSKERSTLIGLQVASWINYAVFQWLSFGTGIPAMFFIPTFTMLLLTLASIAVAFRLDQQNGGFVKRALCLRSITLTFTTLVLWLSVASMLGYYVMTHN